MDRAEVTKQDYLYCETCKQMIDMWNYVDTADAGHEDCITRELTDAEFVEAVADCTESGCFEREDL